MEHVVLIVIVVVVRRHVGSAACNILHYMIERRCANISCTCRQANKRTSQWRKYKNRGTFVSLRPNAFAEHEAPLCFIRNSCRCSPPPPPTREYIIHLCDGLCATRERWSDDTIGLTARRSDGSGSVCVLFTLLSSVARVSTD